MKNPKLYLILIVLLAAILRFWQLGAIPSGIVDDEAKYIYSAYSIWHTGHDITGKFLPLSFNLDTSLSPVPVYLTSPIVGILGVSAFSGRFLMALCGVGSVLLVYFLAKKLLDNTWIGIFAAFSLAISPWDIIVSRSAFEANLALFFYLLAFVLFIYKTKKGNISWSLPAFLLAFYSYHATKVFFVFSIPLIVFLFRDDLLKRRKELFLFISGCMIILFSFLLVMMFEGVSRSSEFFWNNDRVIQESTQHVNASRERSNAPRIIKGIYDNKLLYDLDLVLKNYFHAFSPQILFTEGEESFITGSQHFFGGLLYFSELVLLLVGIIYLFTLRKQTASLCIILFLLIAPLPTAVSSGQEYVLRSIMLLPFISILIGCGYYSIVMFLKNHSKYSSFLLASLFIVFHVFFISRFVYQYFDQFGHFGGEFWQQSTKELSEYIAQNQNNHIPIYLVQAASNFPLQYAIYNQIDPQIMQKIWSQDEKRNIGNMRYLSVCLNLGKGNPKEFLPEKALYIVPEYCYPKSKPDKKIVDSFEPLHTVWKIYEKR